MDRDEELLLAVVNSAPIVDGSPVDLLDGASGRTFSQRWGGTGDDDEVAELRRARDALHSVIRGDDAAALEELATIVEGAVRVPCVTADGVHWDLRGGGLATEAVLAWSNVLSRSPGRLRACANAECNLFLVDHSRPGTAKWCSMATCGNRMKARSHAARSRATSERD